MDMYVFICVDRFIINNRHSKPERQNNNIERIAKS